MKANISRKIGIMAMTLFMAALLPLSLTSCSDDDNNGDVAAALTIGTEQFDYEFSALGDQIIEIPFSSTRDWKVETADANADWLMFSRTEGHAGDHTLYVRLAKNEEADRETSFTLKSEGCEQTFNVRQARTDALIISNPDKYGALPYRAGQFDVTFATNLGDFETNIEYEDGDEPWIDIAPETRAAMVSHTQTFNYTENPAGASRTAHIYICSKVKPDVKDTLDVTQIGAPVPAIKISNKADFSKSLKGVAQDIAVAFEHQYIDELKWEATSDNGNDWFTATRSGNAINLHFTDNAGATNRSVRIHIYGHNTEYDRDLSDEVIITQMPDSRFHVSASKGLATLFSEKGIDQTTLQAIEVVGQMSDADFKLLRTMAKSNALSYIDLSGVTNGELPVFNGSKDNNDGCFNGCTKLETLILPQGGQLKYIPINLCRNCTALTEIEIPEGVEYIDRHAFAGCTAMTKISLPSTITYLYGCCFEKIALKEAHLKTKPLQVLQVMRGTDSKTTMSEVFMNTGNIYKKAKLYVPAQYLDIYKKSNPTLEDLGLKEWPALPNNQSAHTDGKAFTWFGSNEIVAE